MKLILHIGFRKTGTTAVQNYLRDNKTFLNSKCIYVPDFKSSNNYEIALACDLDMNLEYYHPKHKIEGKKDLLNFSKKFFHSLTQDISKKKNQYHTTIISSEDLSLVYTPESINCLKNNLLEIFSEVTIIAYLRRQDKYIISNLSTSLKNGYLLNYNNILYYKFDDLDYNKILNNWGAIFKNSEFYIRAYDNKSLCNNNIINDFCKLIKIPYFANELKNVNKSLSLIAMQYLNIFNLYFKGIKDEKLKNKIRNDLIDILENQYCGDKYSPSSYELKKVLKLFEKSNKLLTHNYFQDAAIFPLETSDCPNFSSALSVETFQEITNKLWGHLRYKHRSKFYENLYEEFINFFQKWPINSYLNVISNIFNPTALQSEVSVMVKNVNQWCSEVNEISLTSPFRMHCNPYKTPPPSVSFHIPLREGFYSFNFKIKALDPKFKGAILYIKISQLNQIEEFIIKDNNEINSEFSFIINKFSDMVTIEFKISPLEEELNSDFYSLIEIFDIIISHSNELVSLITENIDNKTNTSLENIAFFLGNILEKWRNKNQEVIILTSKIRQPLKNNYIHYKHWINFFKNSTVINFFLEEILTVTPIPTVNHDFSEIPLDKLNIIIDSGSYSSYYQQILFSELFPRLKTSGVYIIQFFDKLPFKEKELPINKIFSNFQRSGQLVFSAIQEEKSISLGNQISKLEIFEHYDSQLLIIQKK